MRRNLVAVVFLVGCVDGEIEECQPGDIDCALVTYEDGKADGWDASNDPKRMAQQLNYRFSQLPLAGKLTKPVWRKRYPAAAERLPVAWADTYWPTYDGSHNARWQGATVKSPMEKYDAAFN